MSETQYEINIVLVRPLYASNVGACSRAMSNMGAHQLFIVDRQCEIDYSAQQAAATGQEGLQKRIEYSSWEEFYDKESNGIRIALTARDGRSRQVFDLEDTLMKIRDSRLSQEDVAAPTVENKIYLIFGPEDCGLSFSDVKNCHYCCSIPTFGDNWSLNLAQAVLLALFITRKTWGGTRTVLDGQIRPREIKQNENLLAIKSQKSNLLPDRTIKIWLETLGFDLSKKKVNVYTVMRRILLHNVPTYQEVRILETILQQNIRKLKRQKVKSE